MLLNWQGESAPGTKKGICSTHLRDVQAYFRGAHLTINARNEDEVDADDILQQVAKVSATSYNFKERPMAAEMEEQPGEMGARDNATLSLWRKTLHSSTRSSWFDSSEDNPPEGAAQAKRAGAILERGAK